MDRLSTKLPSITMIWNKNCTYFVQQNTTSKCHSGGGPYFIFTQKKCECELGCFQVKAQGLFVCLFPFVCVQIFNTPDLYPYVRTPTFTCFSCSPVSLQCCRTNSDNCSGFLMELLCDNKQYLVLVNLCRQHKTAL